MESFDARHKSAKRQVWSSTFNAVASGKHSMIRKRCEDTCRVQLETCQLSARWRMCNDCCVRYPSMRIQCPWPVATYTENTTWSDCTVQLWRFSRAAAFVQIAFILAEKERSCARAPPIRMRRIAVETLQCQIQRHRHDDRAEFRKPAVEQKLHLACNLRPNVSTTKLPATLTSRLSVV